MKMLKILSVAFAILFFVYIGILVTTQRYYNYRDTIHHDTIVVIDGNERMRVLRSEVKIVDKVDKVVENPSFISARDNAITVILTAFVLSLYTHRNSKKDD